MLIAPKRVSERTQPSATDIELIFNLVQNAIINVGEILIVYES
jgi:hypothetical protein